MNLSEREYCVMDELYFVIPYSKLVDLVPELAPKLKSTLCDLMEKGYVVQLQFNGIDFLKYETPNIEEIEKHAYLCTKTGLFAHNSY